ncbi:MAG: hypothetical protein LUG61_07145 [Lachnospiraceae bacterium]|nr:hypothetical protein [Lachnospiraceae bacterium]
MNYTLRDQTPAKEKAADILTDPRQIPKANREVKDSVFRDLFLDKKYLLLLYRTLHPEDENCTEDDLICMTLEQILVRDIHNDLGFRVGDKLLVLLEAQSTWSVNILVRSLMYIVRTYQEYFRESEQSLFSTKPVHMPVPELYVVYTGDKVIDKEFITLSEEFFNGRLTALEARMKVLTGDEGHDIISQYVAFTQVANEQIRKYGRTRQAITEAINICTKQDILQEYLERRKREVVDIYATLFDQDQVMEDYIASLRREIREEPIEETTKRVSKETAERVSKETAERVSKETAERVSKETAERVSKENEKASMETVFIMYQDNVPVHKIAGYLRKDPKTIEAWLGLDPQE